MLRFKLRTLLILLALGPPVLISSHCFPEDKTNPGEALYGEWVVVEMIYRGMVQDLNGGPGGWFEFNKEGVIIIPDADTDAKTRERTYRVKSAGNGIRYATVIRGNQLDIHHKFFGGTREWTTKALYDLKDGKLRIIWSENDERPTDFDEAYKDPRLTYYGLKRVAK